MNFSIELYGEPQDLYDERDLSLHHIWNYFNNTKIEKRYRNYVNKQSLYFSVILF